MNKKSVISYFSSVTEAAKALSISQAAVSKWGKIIPEKQAMRLERITDGKLKYNSALYEKAA